MRFKGLKPIYLELADYFINLIEKGAGVPNKEVAGTITREQLKQIAEKKMPDLNANDIEAAMKIIEGSARQMGIKIKD